MGSANQHINSGGLKKIGYYFIHLLVGLIVVRFLQKESIMNNLVGLVILIAHSSFIVLYKRDHFLFLLYLFTLCTMFSRDTLGGITLLPLIFFFNEILAGRLRLHNRFVVICLAILVLSNFAGYLVKNPSDTIDLIQAVILFSGYIISFIYIQNYQFRRSHAKIILKVVALICILLFISAVNQKFVFYDTNFPLLGGFGTLSTSRVNLLYFGRMPSSLGDYELFAEFSLIIFILSFSILMDRKTMEYYKFGNIPYILLFISLINMLITGTRSGILLTGLFLAVFSLVRFRAYFSRVGRRIVLIALVIIPTLLIFGDAIGLDLIIDRFKEINVRNISMESIRSGEELNRDIVYRMGYKRLAEENWLIGYGYGKDESNRKAWLGHMANWSEEANVIRDFHSLYLCIPMIYGWIGGIAYLALILYIIVKLFKKYLEYHGHPIGGILLGFVFVFIFFLIDQYKINSLRVYYYHFLIWILMGFALALINTKKPAIEDSLVHK